MNKIKLFVIFFVYIFDLSFYFLSYSYSKQIDLINIFFISLFINMFILLFNKCLIIISLSTNFIIYVILFFTVITNKFNLKEDLIKRFIFYLFQFQFTGNWLIPIMKQQIKRIEVNKDRHKRK